MNNEELRRFCEAGLGNPSEREASLAVLRLLRENAAMRGALGYVASFYTENHDCPTCDNWTPNEGYGNHDLDCAVMVAHDAISQLEGAK